jgi:hypothetical protein
MSTPTASQIAYAKSLFKDDKSITITHITDPDSAKPGYEITGGDDNSRRYVARTWERALSIIQPEFGALKATRGRRPKSPGRFVELPRRWETDVEKSRNLSAALQYKNANMRGEKRALEEDGQEGGEEPTATIGSGRSGWNSVNGSSSKRRGPVGGAEEAESTTTESTGVQTQPARTSLSSRDVQVEVPGWRPA